MDKFIRKSSGAVLPDGTIVELLYDQESKRTTFAQSKDGSIVETAKVSRGNAGDLAPYSPANTLIENHVVRFPSKAEPYENEAQLVEEVRQFINRYVDLSETFERIAAYYVLFSWVYDAFNELPYLRVRGDFGSGKSRFLLIVGSIAYKPIFGSGASTVSPLFHLLEEFAGTLVIDEADFRFSDEKADLVKILNNGNVRGFPVLRSVAQKSGEYSPRAFHVFGPKLIASRGAYEDKALESRFITEEMGTRPLRKDIPINLPPSYEAEALLLRNKLLMYRFRNRMTVAIKPELVDRAIDARLNQVFVPLLSIIDDASVREAIMATAREHQDRRASERAESIEAQVLTVLKHLFTTTSGVGVAVSDVTELFSRSFGSELGRPVSHRWVGNVLRTRLGLTTHKSNGRFVVPITETGKLGRLYERYGVTNDDVEALKGKDDEELVWEPLPLGDVGTSGASDGVPRQAKPWPNGRSAA